MNVSKSFNKPNQKLKDEMIKPLFDIKTLDFYCRYIISSNQHIKLSGLNLVKELFKRIDPADYVNDPDRLRRIEFINRGLEARIDKRLTESDAIIQYINGGPLDKEFLDISGYEELSDEMLAYLNDQANELVKSYFVDEKYDTILSLATDLKNGNYVHRTQVVNQIQELTSELNMKFNKMDDATSSDTMFTLLPEQFETAFADIYSSETSPSRVLKTGMVGLNYMLDGGFQSNRVYMLFANAAGGKSFTMLDLAMQIKKYNKDYITKDPTKIPTIVFLTMENSKEENISRMMGMISGKTFNDYSLEESMDIWRNNGLTVTEDDPIDIIMIYKPNLSINTDYLYTIVDKLREMGREPICIFQDHIKRIRPVNAHKDIRLDLGEIVNEFKAFANMVGIPVISDSHLNREASKVLDDSSNANAKDLIRTLGSSNVSESYLMIDNCDFGVIIMKGTDSHNNLHMGFKCIKTRTRCDLDMFYQPYKPFNDIKLEEDVTSHTPLFRRSLKEEENILRRGMVNRNSDYTEKLDEDEFFSSDVFGGYEPVQASNTMEVLTANNANQDQFYIVGHPSTSIYAPPIQPLPQQTPNYYINDSIRDQKYREFEDELYYLSNTGQGRMAIDFIDNSGIYAEKIDENNRFTIVSRLSMHDGISPIEEDM